MVFSSVHPSFRFSGHAGSKTRFFFQKLVFSARFVSVYLRLIFGLFSSYIFRLQGDSTSSSLLDKNGNKLQYFEVDHAAEEDHVSELGHSYDEDEEEEKPEVYLKFRFPTYEEFRQAQKERGNELNCEVVPYVDEINDGNGEWEDCSAEGEIDEVEEGIEFAKMSQTDHEEEFGDESDILAEKQSMRFGCDSDVENDCSNPYSDGSLSEIDFGEEMKVESDDEFNYLGDEESDSMEDLKTSEETDQHSDFLSEQAFSDSKPAKDGGDDSENQESEDSDSLWEHQELIEQLKMELRKVRATGLPTILEDSEASPKIMMDDLKPWKIDEFLREDCIGELHKFYKSYRGRMRKFDIVSFQKMYAIGCLQLKDPLQSMMSKQSTFKSLLSHNLRQFKNKIHGTDPVKKFIKEVQDDLETVYVAHACLSWEFLQWQYEKALDLWDSDPQGIRRYNEVAGEFQQFQVLLQRFVEDEPFKGTPRAQNYVDMRRTHRNLLQVTVIRQDNPKDRRKDRHEYAITSEMLVEILEESIRIFWRFVRADKDCLAPRTNSSKKTPELASPEDLELLTEAKKILQKKERRLRDLLRSENCILRKLRRCRGDEDYDQVLCFFSQVDMRLVGRTLNMSKITRDQLLWCHKKLNRISFVDRKIDLEPAFLLFPC